MLVYYMIAQSSVFSCLTCNTYPLSGHVTQYPTYRKGEYIMNRGRFLWVFAVLYMVMTTCVSGAMASTVYVSGADARVTVVKQYLVAHGADVEVVRSTGEVMGVLNGRPWPGVTVSTSSIADGSQGIFVPVSNDAVRTGLCEDQKRLLRAVMPTAPQKSSVVRTAAAKPAPARPTAIGMRVIQTGDACDERAFAGMVPDSVLSVTRGVGGDALEVHHRADKDPAYKAKRGRVLADGIFYPLVWTHDGSCVRIYGKQPIHAAGLKTLLLPGETVVPTHATDVGQSRYGNHLTDSVYVVR